MEGVPGVEQVRQGGGVRRGKVGMGGVGVVVVVVVVVGVGVGVWGRRGMLLVLVERGILLVLVERVFEVGMIVAVGLEWMEREWKDWEMVSISLGSGDKIGFGGGWLYGWLWNLLRPKQHIAEGCSRLIMRCAVEGRCFSNLRYRNCNRIYRLSGGSRKALRQAEKGWSAYCRRQQPHSVDGIEFYCRKPREDGTAIVSQGRLTLGAEYQRGRGWPIPPEGRPFNYLPTLLEMMHSSRTGV